MYMTSEEMNSLPAINKEQLINILPLNGVLYSNETQVKDTLTSEAPMKIRKKPGRKPKPSSPALRKAQNRAAQRAFRERKEHHLKDLEKLIKQLKEQRSQLNRELKQAKRTEDELRAENWYLRGVVLTLQFVCLHHSIHIPTHSPYLIEEDLLEMANSTPHAIESYVQAYTKNNINLKASPYLSNNSFLKKTSDHDANDEKGNKQMEQDELCNQEMDQKATNSMSAIQQIRLQLQLQNAHSNINKKSAPRLQPTLLQLTIAHDPRIDLIPTPHMRDRMILFRDQMDYDHCFSMLLDGASYRGGDPTMSASWELPADFFAEYWFLAINYEAIKTSKWRKLKAIQYQQQDILTEGMPTLQPLDSSHLTSGFDFGSPPSSIFNDYILHRPQQDVLDQLLFASLSEQVSPNLPHKFTLSDI